MSAHVAGFKTGDKIGKATVHVDIVKKGNTEIRPAKAMSPKYITIHNTGNTGKGANALAHNKLMHNMAGKHPRDTSHVSWHVAIDEDNIYIHIPFNETAWHCGDGNGPGNASSIGLEICMHSNQKNYMQAEENAIALCVHLMKHYKLKGKDVRPHQDWSGKYCPQVILKRDGTFTKFRARVDAAYLSTTVKPKEDLPMTQLLNATGRNEIRELLKKARKTKIIDAAFHTDEKINAYSDIELLSYQVAIFNRTFK